jgi:hypothetical protein
VSDEEDAVVENKRDRRIDEEAVCADSLAHYLKDQCGCREVSVVREDNDPPDFWLTIDGEEFAAEVTSVVTGAGYDAQCRKLKEAIGIACKEQGLLRGTYALVVRRHPRLPRTTSRGWRSLVSEASSFVSATKNRNTADEVALLEVEEGSVGIAKVSSRGGAVALVGSPGVKYEDQVQDELWGVMEERVGEKRRRMEKKGVPCRCPRIMLLFYDAYGYADPEDARRALLRVAGYDWFHSVFWSASFANRQNDLYPESPGRKGVFLYSKNEGWWKGATSCFA